MMTANATVKRVPKAVATSSADLPCLLADTRGASYWQTLVAFVTLAVAFALGFLQLEQLLDAHTEERRMFSEFLGLTNGSRDTCVDCEAQPADGAAPGVPFFTQASVQYGAQAGQRFDWTSQVQQSSRLKTVTVSTSAGLLGFLELGYTDGIELRVGRKTDEAETLTLQATEFIARIEYVLRKPDRRLSSVVFLTNKGRTLGKPAGPKHSERYVFAAPAGQQILAFHGVVADSVVGLGVVFAPVMETSQGMSDGISQY